MGRCRNNGREEVLLMWDCWTRSESYSNQTGTFSLPAGVWRWVYKDTEMEKKKGHLRRCCFSFGLGKKKTALCHNLSAAARLVDQSKNKTIKHLIKLGCIFNTECQRYDVEWLGSPFVPLPSTSGNGYKSPHRGNIRTSKTQYNLPFSLTLSFSHNTLIITLLIQSQK